MANKIDSYLQEIRNMRGELNRLLEGIDYCFDWKPNGEEWSSRETVYHMIETPAGGIHTVLEKMLDGNTREVFLADGWTNMTPERQERDLAMVRGEIEAVLTALEKVFSSTTEVELAGRQVSIQSNVPVTDDRGTAQSVVEDIFFRHWREHFGQIAELRAALGLD